MRNQRQEGFSLFEVLVAISVFAVVGVAVTQMISVSLDANKLSGRKSVGVALAQETMEAVNAIILEKWNNLYLKNKGSANKYYPANTAGSCGTVTWCLVSGTQSLALNDLTYKRDIYIENVSRNGSGDIVNSGGTDDPSTQKIIVTVSWEDSAGNQLGSVSMSNYITRSRNAAASQTDWGGAATPTTGENGTFGTNYASKESTVDISGASVRLNAQ